MAELPTQRDFDDFSAWTGRDVLAPDGERLGAVEVIFLDEATSAPEWVLVALGEDDASALVPLAGASVEEKTIRVEQDRERIAAAPRLEVGDTITVAECRRLYEHYDLAYSQQESPTVLPEGAGAQADEERPRLRKYVGSPVAAAEDDKADKADKADATNLPAGEGTGPASEGTGPVEAEAVPDATPPPAPIPPPTPRPIPPAGGFQAQTAAAEEPGGPLALLKRRPALPITLAGGIAALIALLVVRKRR
jgi:hypothetical protein